MICAVFVQRVAVSVFFKSSKSFLQFFFRLMLGPLGAFAITEKTGSSKSFVQFLYNELQFLGAYSKIDVFQTLNVFGNNSRKKLAHRVNLCSLYTMNHSS